MREASDEYDENCKLKAHEDAGNHTAYHFAGRDPASHL